MRHQPVNRDPEFDAAIVDRDIRKLAALVDAGADARLITDSERRAIIGLPVAPNPSRLTVARDEFMAHRTPEFGESNPHDFTNPFWLQMIYAGIDGYAANERYGYNVELPGYDPTWNAQRYAQSITFLADGRVVQIGGAHEDFYMIDFCIFNDVIVYGPNDEIIIYGYPEDVFPGTDYHTATVIGDQIYIVGSNGYAGSRRFGSTPVSALNTNTFRMKRLATTGENPGWIWDHRAQRVDDCFILVTAGNVSVADGDGERSEPNEAEHVLDTESLIWRKL